MSTIEGVGVQGDRTEVSLSCGCRMRQSAAAAQMEKRADLHGAWVTCPWHDSPDPFGDALDGLANDLADAVERRVARLAADMQAGLRPDDDPAVVRAAAEYGPACLPCGKRDGVVVPLEGGERSIIFLPSGVAGRSPAVVRVLRCPRCERRILCEEAERPVAVHSSPGFGYEAVPSSGGRCSINALGWVLPEPAGGDDALREADERERRLMEQMQRQDEDLLPGDEEIAAGRAVMDRILLVPDDMRDAMFSVIVQRERQDGEWGGAEHDEEHTVAEWTEIMATWRHRLERILPDRGERDSAWQPGDLYELGDGVEEHYRRHLVILAALLIAIIQCIDRSRADRGRRPGRPVDGR